MEDKIRDLEVRVANLEANKNDVNVLVAVITEKLDNIVKSIDKLSLQYERNISEINAKYDDLAQKYDKLKEEVRDKTIGKDAEKWNKIVAALITGVVGVLIGILFK